MSFDFLCRAADYDDAREDVSMDIDDFQMAFEQLYCGGDPLEEDVAVELMAAVNEMGWRADVTLSEWNRFHAMWAEATTAPAYIEAILERKKADSAAGYERMRRDTIEKELQEKLDEAVAAQAEAVAQPAAATPEPAAAVPASNSSSKLVRDTAAAMVAVGSKLVGDKPTAEKPTLLASYSAKTAAKKAASSEPSTAAVARYRSLDLAAWSRVVDDVGGLHLLRFDTVIARKPIEPDPLEPSNIIFDVKGHELAALTEHALVCRFNERVHETEKLRLALGPRRVLPKVRQIARSRSDQGARDCNQQHARREQGQPTLRIVLDACPYFSQIFFEHNRFLAPHVQLRFAGCTATTVNNRYRAPSAFMVVTAPDSFGACRHPQSPRLLCQGARLSACAHRPRKWTCAQPDQVPEQCQPYPV